MELNFLGRGNCFNTEQGNNSAYLLDSTKTKMLLFDCGGSVFKKIKPILNIYTSINHVMVYITHLHDDHIGSLGSLIFYCKYILNIQPTVICSSCISKDLETVLTLTGVSKDYYKLTKINPSNKGKNLDSIGIFDGYFLHCVETRHIGEDRMKSYPAIMNVLLSSKIITPSDSFVYATDVSTLEIIEALPEKFVGTLYLDCSIRESGAHLTLKEIRKNPDIQHLFKRDCLKLMHIEGNPEDYKEYQNSIVGLQNSN